MLRDVTCSYLLSPQGSIFALRHAADSEPASKNKSK